MLFLVIRYTVMFYPVFIDIVTKFKSSALEILQLFRLVIFWPQKTLKHRYSLTSDYDKSDSELNQQFYRTFNQVFNRTVIRQQSTTPQAVRDVARCRHQREKNMRYQFQLNKRLHQ